MPLNYSIDSGKKLARLRAHGHFTLADIHRGYSGLLADPEYQKGMDAIWDFTDADMSKFRTSDLKLAVNFARQNIERRGRARAAIVAPKDLQYGLMRVFKTFAENQIMVGVQVFREQKDALAWLESGD